MRTTNKKIYVVYILLMGIIFYNIFFARLSLGIYNNIINPLSWLALSTLVYFYVGKEDKRQKHNKDKLEIIFIIMLFYFIIYFLLGLILTFTKNVYSTEIISIIKNIWSYLSVVIFKEFVRNKLVDNSGSKILNLVIITILFICTDISFYNIATNLSSSEIMFKFSFQTICPIIFANIVCTFLCTISNSYAAIIYRGIMVLLKIVPPIQPRFDWFMQGMFESILPVVIFAITNYYHTKKTSLDRRRDIRKSNPISKLILVIAFSIFGFFIGGFFKYSPTAVMSGSMNPIFSRGDIVIVEKMDENDFQNVQLNDIIAYRLENRIVLHRVIKIDDSSQKVSITTKGDNNENPDKDPVTKEMFIGIVRTQIKYIGYPSVLLSEYFSK